MIEVFRVTGRLERRFRSIDRSGTTRTRASIRPPYSPHENGGFAMVVGCEEKAREVLATGNVKQSFEQLKRRIDL